MDKGMEVYIKYYGFEMFSEVEKTWGKNARHEIGIFAEIIW